MSKIAIINLISYYMDCEEINCKWSKKKWVTVNALRCLLFILELPDNGFVSNWSLSMKQCTKSQPYTYLLGDVNLDNPELVCERLPLQLQVGWVGVTRTKYINIDQGIY